MSEYYNNRLYRRFLIKYFIWLHLKLNNKKVHLDSINYYFNRFGELESSQIEKNEKIMFNRRYNSNISKLKEGNNYNLTFPIMETGDTKWLSYYAKFVNQKSLIDQSNLNILSVFIGYKNCTDCSLKEGLFKVVRINFNDVINGDSYIEVGDTIEVDLYYYNGYF